MMSVNSFFQNVLFDRKYWIVRHLLFWLIMYTDEVLAMTGVVDKQFNIKSFASQIAADLCLVYFNLYFLIPRYLTSKRIGTYITGTLLSIAAAILSNYFIIINLISPTSDIVVMLFRSFLLTLGVLATAVSIKIIKKTLTSQQKLRALEKLNYDTEVNYLKMQVNPHFLFNTLNNIYIQSKKYPAVVPDSIMKLSDLMRYQIYNGSKQTVALQEDLKFLSDYLELEQIRRDNMTIEVNWDISNKELHISPMLFIPLVENAIKHSTTNDGAACSISAYCTTHRGEIIFDISNTVGQPNESPPGIGLKNLKRRLEILYPNRHILNIQQLPKKYTASLRIDTND